MSEPTYPDIEIYLKRIETDAIIEWLGSIFEDVNSAPRGNATVCTLTTRDGHRFDCTITEKVAKGGFVSVWFKSDKTPWATDKDCAQAAFEHFQVEVRCSRGGWEGEDEAGWIRITDKGEQIVNWHQ